MPSGFGVNLAMIKLFSNNWIFKNRHRTIHIFYISLLPLVVFLFQQNFKFMKFFIVFSNYICNICKICSTLLFRKCMGVVAAQARLSFQLSQHLHQLLSASGQMSERWVKDPFQGTHWPWKLVLRQAWHQWSRRLKSLWPMAAWHRDSVRCCCSHCSFFALVASQASLSFV